MDTRPPLLRDLAQFIDLASKKDGPPADGPASDLGTPKEDGANPEASIHEEAGAPDSKAPDSAPVDAGPPHEASVPDTFHPDTFHTDGPQPDTFHPDTFHPDTLQPDLTPPPSCSDQEKNGDESDVDCGGSCPPCLGG